MTSPTRTNRLADQSSPYLLQHAHNPVDWRPWGDEAFAEARRRDVPVFLSIGYSTCYWCHVMERESFEHEPTASLMNERFVCVKVDREERPDVDDIYMTATQVMTGRGGWPMSCFLEPDRLRPCWCGTYFPREPRHGLPSFAQVLRGMSDAWRERRDEVLQQSEQVAGAVREALAGDAEPVPVGAAHVSLAVESLLRSLDRTHGGFGGAPKFPQPANLMLLLDARASADDDTRAAIDAGVRTTLDRMAIGGVRDQVGGGFHRYAVDETWTVPHFEKMLYDNAQLATVYARAARLYDDEYYRRVTRATLDDALRDMGAGDEPGASGFFSALDAEVYGREGLNYLWTPEEIRAALPEDDAALAIRVYALDKGANFQDPHHPEEPARNVLRLMDRPDRLAPGLGLTAEQLDARLESINLRLLAARSQRRQPGVDDKVIVAWNGLMIEALVEGAETLNDARYVESAERAAGHILGRMRSADETLLRIERAGQASTPAFLEDHAALVRGLVALARSRSASAPSRLEDAAAIADLAHEAFAADTGYFDTRADQSDLFVRTRSTYDGAMPCGSSLMLGALLSLAEATGEERFLDRAVGVLASLSPRLAQSPVSIVEGARQLLRMLTMRDRVGSRYAFAAGAAPEPATPAPPVRAFVSADRVEVGEDRPASLRLRLEIDPPHHIVAAHPGADALSPLRVGLVRGQGVAVYADYPEGEQPASELPGVGTARVHHGVIELDIALERRPGVGAGPGDPVLGVSFQACTDTECLRPMTIELGVEIDLLD